MSVALCAGLLGVCAAPAAAQGAKAAVTGGVDFSNRYNFRGIRQNGGEVSIWPFADVGVPVLSDGKGGLKSVTVNVGTWNAFHSELPDNKWYESDLYGTLGLGFGMTTLGFTYTSYMSPGDYWHNVQELAVKLSVDDSSKLGKSALKPYGLVAFELGDGQADGGRGQGRLRRTSASLRLFRFEGVRRVPDQGRPERQGLLRIRDRQRLEVRLLQHRRIATVPVNSHWNVHGGSRAQVFGDNLKAYNGFGDNGDRKYAPIASIGLGFSY
jgi:hypothetical protein